MAVSFDFSGYRVLVTGGSNGLGLAMATRFKEAGAEVVITGRRAGPDDYEHDLSGFDYRQCVMTDHDQIASVAGSLEGLDVLINNAGQNMVLQNEWSPDVFDEVLQVNLSSVFRMSTACRGLLAASPAPGGASILNVGSLTSTFAIDLIHAYGASKAAVVHLTKTLAVAWAKDGIRANALVPGLTATNMTEYVVTHPEANAPHLARTPLGRLGSVDDVAPLALFLASDVAGYITGEAVLVDGGWSVQG